MRTPPGVKLDDFEKAIKQFQDIVGKEWVFTSDEDLNVYRDAYSPYLNEPEERIASAAIAPKETEQVQKILKIANQYKIPLYTISTGKNLGYGGSAPVYSGCVVLDLKRMNKIIEVNEQNAYALVEPGVSYFDLYRYIQEKGLKLWIDVPQTGWGSLIGNALDRGCGYTVPHLRNHFEAHCGMEVVLPNGELMRTGMGAIPNSKTWQQYKTGLGPWVDGLFSQSNFGVVTKMGFWLMPEPEAYFRGQILLSEYKDLTPFVKMLNYLENSGIFNGTPGLGSPLLGIPQIDGGLEMLEEKKSPLTPEHSALLQKAELGYSPELEEYGKQKRIPYWKCSLTFYGPAKSIQAQWEYSKEKILTIIPNARFEENETIKLPLTLKQRENVNLHEFGIPSLRNFGFGARSSLNPQPGHGHIWFAPIIPRTGEAIFEVNKVFTEVSERLEVPKLFPFILPTCYWERSFVCTIGFFLSEDVNKNKKTRLIFEELLKACAQHGWGEYRSPAVFQDLAMGVYSFNNHALLKFHETLKDAIDPNGILSPGRYGIWPQHLRGQFK